MTPPFSRPSFSGGTARFAGPVPFEEGLVPGRGRKARHLENARTCQHCGTPFQPRFSEEHFCCSGCRVVHDLIRGGGFSTFYELLGRQQLQPADQGDPAADQLAELEEAVADAESGRPASGDPARLTLRVGNLSCTACVWLIDHLFRRHAGALKITSDTSRSTLTLWWSPGQFDAVAFLRDLHRYGYPASLLDELDEEDAGESRSLLTRLGVTGGLAMNTMVFTLPVYAGLETGHELARLFALVAFASASLALAVGGSYFFQRAWSSMKARALHMDAPISLGLVAAYLGSVGGLAFGVDDMIYFDFVAIFAFLMLLGRYFHLRLVERNRQQLRARERDLSATFRLDREGRRERILLRKIEKGDLLEIPGGAMVPVQAELREGQFPFHLDWINGEPDPVPFRAGQSVPAGARNASPEPVVLLARESFTGSFLEQLLQTGTSQEAKEAAPANPILKYYLLAVLAVALLGSGAWAASGAGLARALQVLISILVVSCPCALGLALPLLDEMVLAKLRRSGIFIRRHSLWKRLRGIRVLAFDKTGTLTEPVKKLADDAQLENLEDEALRALRHLTATNHHPVGRALHEVLTARFGLEPRLHCEEIRDEPGQGVETRLGAHLWRLGRPGWACSGAGPDPKANQETGTKEGGCVLARDGVEVARFRLEEAIRDGAMSQLEQLRQGGYRLTLLSGDPDRERVAEMARRLGIEAGSAFSGLTPEEKARHIARESPGSTLFVGDGGNDSFAFEEAAATGTPATGIRAIEHRADFVFTGRGFHALGQLLAAAARRRRLVVGIFAFALSYNLITVSVCLAGLMNPLLAAILMPLSSVVATTIATRV